MYIGLSLGKCMVDILADRVEEDKVALIITGTMAPTYDRYVEVINEYYSHGNYGARGYNLHDYEWDRVILLAERLWNQAKIHQPRNFGASNTSLTSYARGEVWLEIVPTLKSSNQSVVDAYEKYRILSALTE
jgi:hypothetical protein